MPVRDGHLFAWLRIAVRDLRRAAVRLLRPESRAAKGEHVHVARRGDIHLLGEEDIPLDLVQLREALGRQIGLDHYASLIEGRVRCWHADEGWGVIDATETPGGCWTHFSAVDMEGYRALRQGQLVALTVESPGQDGYPYRAVRVTLSTADNGDSPAAR